MPNHGKKRARFESQKTQRGTAATEVAQNCILPYRGFVIRWPQPNRTHPENRTFIQMQFGDTATSVRLLLGQRQLFRKMRVIRNGKRSVLNGGKLWCKSMKNSPLKMQSKCVFLMPKLGFVRGRNSLFSFGLVRSIAAVSS